MIDQFYIDSRKLFSILSKRGIQYLYHANSVATSLTFIENRALLSRHYVETNGLIQSPQKSDNADKLFNVWDDVFLDGLDLGPYYNRPNEYGPVLFILKLDILTSPSINRILVTRTNPMFWNEKMTTEERYFKTAEEVDEAYLKGNKKDHARIMFTLRSPDTSIKLNKFLHKIVIDKCNYKHPKADNFINIDSAVEDRIIEYIKESGLSHIELEFRNVNYSRFIAGKFEKFKTLFKFFRK